MREYFSRVYDARYFWLHLARIELMNRFRRSKLGILWVCINPLCLTAIMSVVFGVAFKQDIASYAPYILSGLIFWDLFSGAFVTGNMAIIANEPYIRQFNHPLTIYTLKSGLVLVANFLIELVALMIWVLFIHPTNILVGLFTLPATILIYFPLAWGGVTIAAFVCTKYRDYPQVAALVMQAFWYISPVFMQESLFQSNPILLTWFNTNPITHLLYLVRMPFLKGQLPSPANYLISILFVVFIDFLAIRINKSWGKDLIFYI